MEVRRFARIKKVIWDQLLDTKAEIIQSKLYFRFACIMPELNLEQPRSQGLSSYHPLERTRKDPGTRWSRATLTVENIREGSSVIGNFVALSFLEFKVSRCDFHYPRCLTALSLQAFRLKFE